MKCFALCLPAMLGVGLVACDSMDRPMSEGRFDPLRLPGTSDPSSMGTSSPTFSPGQFVRAAMDNTAFFKDRPKGEGDADKLLPRGSSMKVISMSASYLKVELDSGEVGYVPAVMVEDPNATPALPPPGPGEFQIYPPVGNSTPPPPVPPTEQPPEGAIPTVIDPDAPSPPAPN